MSDFGWKRKRRGFERDVSISELGKTGAALTGIAEGKRGGAETRREMS